MRLTHTEETNLTTINQPNKGKMKKITVEYGVDSINKQVESDFTIGDLQDSDSIKAALGLYRRQTQQWWLSTET